MLEWDPKNRLFRFIYRHVTDRLLSFSFIPIQVYSTSFIIVCFGYALVCPVLFSADINSGISFVPEVPMGLYTSIWLSEPWIKKMSVRPSGTCFRVSGARIWTMNNIVWLLCKELPSHSPLLPSTLLFSHLPSCSPIYPPVHYSTKESTQIYHKNNKSNTSQHGILQ